MENKKSLQDHETRYLFASSESEAQKPNGIFCCHRTRFLILFIALICFTLTLSNALALNFTIICMKPIDVGLNGTEATTSVFTPQQQGWLFSAIAVGNFIGALPLPYFTAFVGTRTVFSIYGFLSALATLASPLAVTYGFYPLFLMRVFQGIATSVSLPALGSMTSQWATIGGSGIFLCLLSTHLQFAQIFTMPVSGLFCESSIGWQGIFYLQGVLTVIAFVVFVTFFRDSPELHKNVSNHELTKISRGKPVIQVKSKIPYYQICTDKSIIGIWLESIGGAFGFQIFCQYGPIYLNKVLNMDVRYAGLAAAIPFICSLAVKMISGPLSDKAHCFSQKARVIFFASLSQYFMAICFILLAWMPFKSPWIAQLLYTLTIVFSGINVVGVIKSATLQSMQYAYFVMTVVSFISSSVVLIMPHVIGFLAPNNSATEWSTVFYGIGILLAVVVTIFNFTCETEPRPWTEPIPASIPLKQKVSIVYC